MMPALIVEAVRGAASLVMLFGPGSGGANPGEVSMPDTVVSEEVSFPVGTRTVPGTLTRPATGRGPALLLLAGSGPTDRDWNSPLMAGKNGSARLLAEALSRSGYVVLRFDKAFTGKNPGLPITELTLDTYVAEARAGLALLRSRPEVDPTRMFVAGHSEGAIHAIRLTQAEPAAIRGLVLLAGPGRSLRDVLLTQLEGNFRDAAKMPPDRVAAEMAPIRAALNDFVAGKDVDPATVSTIPQITGIMTALMAKPVAGIGRALVSFEPATEVVRVSVPVLVLQGGKDIQVDPVLDAEVLEKALRAAGRNVTRHLSPDADHVLKSQPMSTAEIRGNLATVAAGYNAEGRSLDPDVLAALIGWLRERVR